jgi:hypothetical protein
MDASSPARKVHVHEIHEKAGSISNTFELPWPVRGDMKKRPSTKGWPEPPKKLSAAMSKSIFFNASYKVYYVQAPARGLGGRNKFGSSNRSHF